MELDDDLVVVVGEVAALEVRAEVVHPAQPAALAAAEEARGLGQRAPATLAVRLDVGDQALVLLLGPRALVRVRLLAARRPPHACCSLPSVPLRSPPTPNAGVSWLPGASGPLSSSRVCLELGPELWFGCLQQGRREGIAR